MEVIGSIFVLLAPLLIIIGIIGLIKGNVKSLRINNRVTSIALLATSIIVFAIGGSLLPDKEQGSQTASQSVATVEPSPSPSMNPLMSSNTEKVTKTPKETPSPKQISTPEPSNSTEPTEKSGITEKPSYDVVIHFPEDRYPETAAHIEEAIESGESPICTIDRDGADENRDESLDGVPTKDGYDRDEWPMAMCAEGGEGADIEYIDPSDNRGSGSWVGNQLEEYSDGTRVFFVIDGGKSGSTSQITNVEIRQTPNPTPEPTPESTVEPATSNETVYYKNCTAARNAGVTPLYSGDPGYDNHLDRDGDGVACE